MLLPWARGKPMAWDVTVPDTYAESHISSTVVKAGAAAHREAQSKTDKYASLASTHIFCPLAIETAGARHETAIEVTQEIGRRITVVTEDTRKSSSSNACPWLFNGGCGLLPKYYDHRIKCRCSHLLYLASIFPPAALCLWA